MSRGLDELFANQGRTLTVAEAAALLGRTNQTIYRWITAGTIPAYRIGKEWVIITADLKATMQAASNTTESPEKSEEDEAP